MRAQLLIVPVIVGLGAVVVWRVQAQDAYKHAPSGGSTTVEGTETSAASKTGGRLIEVRVREGDVVAAGDVIARLDCSDADAALATAHAHIKNAEAQLALAVAGSKGAKDAAAAAAAQVAAIQSQVRAAEVQKAQAETERARMEALAKQNAVPGRQVDQVTFADEAAAEQVGAAKASVHAARMQSSAAAAQAQAEASRIEVARTGVEIAVAESRRAELAVAECTIAAPTGGTVQARLHEPGAVLAPGSPVVTILDTRVVTATFFLPNAELDRVAPGMPAELRVDSFRDRVFTGSVRRISVEAEFTPRNVQTREDRDRLVYAVEVELPNDDGVLRAGMPGQITIPGT
ncbi:MAG: HlyD family efflux transporter periplasmic adaptor subunit, partial [Myxococcales bacterium]|nr:HlyD family efflux transporter periplasmic adaptor subunit [Myxococcales bacterium]